MNETEKAGMVGTVAGILITLVLAVLLLNLGNYQPVPNCHEDAVLMEVDSDLTCVPRAKFHE